MLDRDVCAQILACIVITAAAVAPSASGASYSGTLTRWDLGSSPAGLQIKLENIAPSCEWVVAIKVQGPGDLAGAVIAGRTVGRKPASGLPILSGDLADLPVSSFRLGLGSVDLNGAIAGKNGLLLYVVLPQSSPVSVSANGAIVINGAIANSLMVRTGQVISEPVNGLGSAVARLSHAYALPAPDLMALPTGQFLAGPVEAGRHNTIAPLPRRFPGAAGSRAVLELTIAADGHVSGIRTVSGGQALADALSPFLLQWQFTPFENNGRPVQAITRVVLTGGRDGAVSHAF